MTIKEFEKLTGTFPSNTLYTAIETAYYEYDGDKFAFCAAYKANENSLAERIQSAANDMRDDELMNFDKEIYTKNEEIMKKDAEIAALKRQLEAEQEWKPYEDTDNVAQADYEKLAGDSSTEVMDDNRAKALLYDWFGFATEKIKIHRSVPMHEVSRHRQLRKIGEIERLPLYNATDWNYIRFDCGCMSYELTNGEIRLFVH